MLKARIIATGSYLPEKVLSNADLEKIVDTSDEWIVTRTGMKERRIAGDNESNSDMGACAGKNALEKSSLKPEDIDFIIVSTITPDFPFPSTACLIQKKLGLENAAAVDIQATCSGYLYALDMAKAFVESGRYKNILVVASEKLSSIVDYQERTTCVLFGDGAGACIVSAKGKGLFVESIALGADGNLDGLIYMPAGGSNEPASVKTVEERKHFIKMNGKEVFKNAVRRMEKASKDCLEECGLSEKDVEWFIAHQANDRIIEAVGKRFSHLSKKQIYKTIHKYGNTSASSVAIALDELLSEEKIEGEGRILLTAFGSGLVWGAAILKPIEE
jgi:3-oxoacyl-[acyl-carrier-protein] synthase-3